MRNQGCVPIRSWKDAEELKGWDAHLTWPMQSQPRPWSGSDLGEAQWEGGLVEAYTELDRQRTICTIKLQIWHITTAIFLFVCFFTFLFIGCNYKPALPKLVEMVMPQEDGILAPISFLQLGALRCSFADIDPSSGMQTQSPILDLVTGGCWVFGGKGALGRCILTLPGWALRRATALCSGRCCICLWVRQNTRGAALNIPLIISGKYLISSARGSFALFKNWIFLRLQCRALPANYWPFWS